MKDIQAEDRLIVALDVDSSSRAIDLLHLTRPYAHTYKVGSELFTALGPSLLDIFDIEGIRVFLDLKLHDIPNTVAATIKRAVEHGVDMLTIHTLGGPKMLARAAETIAEMDPKNPLQLLAVSVLTHHDEEDLAQIGFTKNPQKLVLDLLELSFRAGIRGCVCSPHEVAEVRKAFGEDFIIVCPGVRPTGTTMEDQVRVGTPFETIRNGADYIVVGRPITCAADPAKMAEQILNEIKEGLNARK